MIEINRNDVVHEIEVDILEELNYYDWNRARVKTNEMVACSPFRDEHSPSFSINLETGLWIDFGSNDYLGKGNIVQLLSYLRNETPQEVENYLLDKYGIDLSDADKLSLNFDLNIDTDISTNFSISIDTYKQYAFRSPYLGGRGISEKVQRSFKVGYDKKGKAVAFPWMNIEGKIINIKFRSISSKQFYYYPDGQPIRNHLYGMHFIYKLNIEKVFIVESEIDCLYLWSHGIPAIALGGSNVSKEQKQLILRSPIKNLVIATDNDRVGKEIRENIVKTFIGSKELFDLEFPEDVKDVNELSPEYLKNVIEKVTPVEIVLFKA